MSQALFPNVSVFAVKLEEVEFLMYAIYFSVIVPTANCHRPPNLRGTKGVFLLNMAIFVSFVFAVFDTVAEEFYGAGG